MSVTNTTLSSALAQNATKANFTGVTGLLKGMRVRIDGELFQVAGGYASGNPVSLLRAQEGTVNQAHASGAVVTYGLSSDTAWGSQAPQTVVQYPLATRAQTIDSYSASGAITLPDPGSNKLVYLNGTVALAMTLAAPTVGVHDGCVIEVQANGKATHTLDVDATNGVGNAGSSYDRLTFLAGGTVGVRLIAINGFWNASQIGATNTNIVPTIS